VEKAVVLIRFLSKNGFRDTLIFFLGLNLAWIETSVNTIVSEGPDKMLGWLPFDWYLTAVEWFWIHFSITALSIAVLLYLDQLWTHDQHRCSQEG
jgi:hypothetical protein